MTKSTKLALRTLALAGLTTSLATHAMQVVQPVKDSLGTNFSSGANATTWTGTAVSGSMVTIIGRYTSDLGNESGLGLKILYDEAKFTGVTVTALNTKCMIAPPQIQPNGASSKAVLGWIDTAARSPAGSVGWPYLADPSLSSSTSPCLSPNTNPANNILATDAGAVNLFEFKGTLAVGAGNTAAVSIVSDGNFSYAGNTSGMADQLVTITAVAAPNCNLDVDGDGSVLAAKDGTMIQRALNPNITDLNVTAGITITGPRNTGALIRSHLNGFVSGGVGVAANLGSTVLDVDSNSSTTSASDGNAIKRALNVNITAGNVITGLTVAAGTTGQSIRQALNSRCGLSLPTN